MLFSQCERDGNSPIQFLGSKYVLRSRDLTVEIDPNIGGRITSYKLGDVDVLLHKTINKENYGSTLWPSPQNWPWPPSSVLDRMAYASNIQGDTLHLHSYPDPVTGLRFSKSFWIDKEKQALTINYFITNISTNPISVGPWEVTRVPYGGICFFPSDSLIDPPQSNLLATQSKGITWFKHNVNNAESAQKYFGGAKLGWLAHVNSGVIFVKTFPDIDITKIAPGQGEVEIYANKSNTYLELENHGAFSTLKPGESLSYPTRWYLKSLNPGIKPEILNQELIKAVNTIIYKN